MSALASESQITNRYPPKKKNRSWIASPRSRFTANTSSPTRSPTNTHGDQIAGGLASSPACCLLLLPLLAVSPACAADRRRGTSQRLAADRHPLPGPRHLAQQITGGLAIAHHAGGSPAAILVLCTHKLAVSNRISAARYSNSSKLA